MTKYLMTCILFTIIVANAFAADSQLNDSSRAPAYDSFRLVVERNIFDKNRKPHQVQQEAKPASAPVRKVDHLDLLGTLVADAHPIAFINGGRHSPVAPGEELFNWTIDSISTEAMILSLKGQKITWPIGSGLERVNEGEWRITQSNNEISLEDFQLEEPQQDRSRSSRDSSRGSSHDTSGNTSRDSSRSSSSDNSRSRADRGRGSSHEDSKQETSTPTNTTPTTGADASDEDVAKRMMERRQKEGGQ